ncbi:MAG: glycosyltransferase family 4 protein [Verrucomicrobiota bacterium]|nr:glycosyltransferase family 4 protein [Verrucomicrobiota bacterium]
MRTLFLNQYFPPDPAPTGVLLHELGAQLSAAGHEVEFISSRQNYRKRPSKIPRIIRELAALASILWRGLWTRRPHLVFSASSPPCMLVAATIIAKKHRVKSVHWAMDLYPELAVALGEIPPGLLSRFVGAAMGWAYRNTDLLVALDEDMARLLEKYGATAHVIHPWVLAPLLVQRMEAEQTPTPMWTWIYSGNLGRAHEWETLLEAQAILEQRALPIRLLFQGGGPSWPAAKARAAALGLKNCDWNDYVAEDQLRDSLLAANVVIVTQRPEARGLVWPSKLALLLDLARPILWIGENDGAIAQTLSQAGTSGIFQPREPGKVAEWIEAQYRRKGEGCLKIEDAVVYREQAFQKWANLLSDFGLR